MKNSSDQKHQKGIFMGGTSRSETIVGVEIAYNSIYMVRFKKSPGGEASFVDCYDFEFDPSLSIKSSAFVSVLKAGLKSFCSSSKGIEIWASPLLDQARLHHIKMPPVSQNRLPGAVFWALQREEPFLEKETVVDFQIEKKAASGSNLEITGVLTERSGIEELEQLFAQAGYPLTGIGLPLLAIRNLVNLRSLDDKSAPVLICQVGQLSTSVSVLLDQRLVFSRNISTGLQSLADTVVQELDPMPTKEEATALILKLGVENDVLCSEDQELNEKIIRILTPVLERVSRQIERTIEYYQSNFDSEPIETIFLGGITLSQGQLFRFLSSQLSSNVVSVDPFDSLEAHSESSFPENHGDRIAFGTAFGLALEAGQSINLGHTYKARQNEARYRKIATTSTLALMILAIAATLFFYWKKLQLSDLHAESVALEKSLSVFDPQLSEASIMQVVTDVRLLQERRKAATKRYETIAILSEITNLTPQQISILQMSASMEGTMTFFDTTSEEKSKISKSAETTGVLFIEGIVSGERTSLETSLTIYVARLEQSDLFRAVEVKSTELLETTGKLVLNFTLSVNLTEEKAIDAS